MARTTFTAAEGEEIRGLLDELPHARRAVPAVERRPHAPNGTGARGRIRWTTHAPTVRRPSFLSALKLEAGNTAATTIIRPHPSGRVFCVAVGVTGQSVDENWNPFEERFQWFGQSPHQVASGDHLFVLAVDRWRSAVVGLYEAVPSDCQAHPTRSAGRSLSAYVHWLQSPRLRRRRSRDALTVKAPASTVGDHEVVLARGLARAAKAVAVLYDGLQEVGGHLHLADAGVGLRAADVEAGTAWFVQAHVAPAQIAKLAGAHAGAGEELGHRTAT